MSRGIRGAGLATLATVALAATTACHHGQEVSEAPVPETQEMVNVGYGQLERGTITGSVQALVVTEMDASARVRTVEELIQGRFSGVRVFHNPGGGISVRIRGTNSILGNNEPLYVIDGMPIQSGPGGALIGINPMDIERIEVLKDAGSTAIYGVRGANGVILITTKRAR